MEIQGNIDQTANILIVDDVIANLVVLTEIIKQAGFIGRPVTSVKQAMQAIEVCMPQLILLDISMPEIDGFEYCAMLKKNIKTRHIPIIFISALNSTEDKIKGFKLGAVDFISKPFEIEEVTLRVNTHLKIYRMQQELEIYNKKLQKLVNEQLYKIFEEQKTLIFTMAKLSEARDDASGNHLENIEKNCRLLAMSLQFCAKYEKKIGNTFVDTISQAAALHDIGKIAIPDRILLKPGKLTLKEMEVMKTHSEIGAKTLQEVYLKSEQNEFLKMAIDIAYYHHEKWNGTGYPKGLKGEEIPLSARITAVADVYDTLISERCYKSAYPHQESMEIMQEESGKSFDPDIIEVLVKVQRQLKRD